MSQAPSTEGERKTVLGRVRNLLPRRRSTRAVAFGVLLALSAGGIYGAHAWAARGAADTQYAVETVQRGDLEDTVTATGILQPRDYVDVGTQVSG